MLATANNVYWVVLDRDALNTKENKTVLPIETSDNFKGECDPNKNVHMKVLSEDQGSGEPWINMGSSYACGNNYMFWGEDNFQANEQFRNENGGIMIYVGGSFVPKEKNSASLAI